jgi:hypothetical protein
VHPDDNLYVDVAHKEAEPVTVYETIPPGDAPPIDLPSVGLAVDMYDSPGGDLTVTLYQGDYPDPPGTLRVASRYWEISADFTDFACTLVFDYDEADLGGTPEEDLAGAARWDEATQQWEYLACTVDTAANTVTCDGVTAFSSWLLVASTPPQAVADLSGSRTGSDLELTWPAVTEDILGNPLTPDHYVVYRRADEPYFGPSPSDVVATPATPGFTDPGVLGDPAHNYYYVVTAVDGLGTESAPSIRLGAFDQALTPAAGPDERAYNLIAVNLDVPGVTDADALAAYVGAASGGHGVYMVLHHDAEAQSLEWRLPGLAGTNFAVGAGDAVFLYLDETAPPVLSLVGAVPPQGSVSFDLARPEPGGSCTYNFVSVPLGRDDLVDADALAAEIGGVYSVSRYDAATQTLIWRLPGVSGPNFDVRTGYPYIVCLDETAPASWP